MVLGFIGVFIGIAVGIAVGVWVRLVNEYCQTGKDTLPCTRDARALPQNLRGGSSSVVATASLIASHSCSQRALGRGWGFGLYCKLPQGRAKLELLSSSPEPSQTSNANSCILQEILSPGHPQSC